MNSLRYYREKAGIGLRELSRRIGVAAPNLSMVETGIRQPWPALIEKYSRELGVPIDALTSYKDDE